jgi:hypothetical protein
MERTALAHSAALLKLMENCDIVMIDNYRDVDSQSRKSSCFRMLVDVELQQSESIKYHVYRLTFLN